MNSIDFDYDEVESNKYVTKTMIFACFVLMLSCILNEIELYHFNKIVMRSTSFALLCITLYMFVFVNSFHHASMPITKYIVLGVASAITLCDVSVLGFFTIPFLIYPIVAGTHYKSKSANIFAIGGALLASLLSPYIGIKYRLWDSGFFVWLVNLMLPGIIPYDTYIELSNGAASVGMEGVFTFIALPNFLNVLILGMLSMTVNISRRHRYEQRINNLLDMRDKVLYSMADIIENRDSSTGGHVKRTSNLVSIMTKHLKEHPITENLDDDFYESLIKGAPMHDIGKITVSDTILCKPGKLTDEEFAKIKSHPVESGRMLEQLLTGIEDEKRLSIIKKMARYHHEKYDGSGYPEGLNGDEIPLEARIMAIADVYDALVSKRCYKTPMSHEEAYDTILNSMGSHFDPKLEDCFKRSYNDFIQYYESLSSNII